MADPHTSLRHRNSCVSTQSNSPNLGNEDALDMNKENRQGVIGKTFEGDGDTVCYSSSSVVQDMLTS